MPTQDEIDDVLNACAEAEEDGKTAYPGMTYEQGVSGGIQWLQGHGEKPLS